MHKPRMAMIAIGLLAVLTVFCSTSFAYQDQALIEASLQSDLKQVRDLLGNGADANAKITEGFTAIWLAEGRQHHEIVELLKAHGTKE
jgi:ankyrin repeat protein